MKTQVYCSPSTMLLHMNINRGLVLNWTWIGAELDLDWSCFDGHTRGYREKDEFCLLILCEFQTVNKNHSFHKLGISEKNAMRFVSNEFALY